MMYIVEECLDSTLLFVCTLAWPAAKVRSSCFDHGGADAKVSPFNSTVQCIAMIAIGIDRSLEISPPPY